MRAEKLPRALLIAGAALLAAAALLLPRGAAGTKLVLPGGGRAVLYGADTAQAALTVTEEDGHSHVLDAGGTASAALLLGGRGEGTDALASELARRGVRVLAADAGTDAAEAWDRLVSQPWVRLSSVALVAGPERSKEALRLAESLAGGGREPAALILRGGEALLKEAAHTEARNVLVLVTDEPDAETVEAFLGEEERRPGWIGGYFAEGSARAAVRCGSSRWADKTALMAAIDWLGSTLGHAVELPDDDLPALAAAHRRTAACIIAGAGAAACATAGILYLKRRNDRRDRDDA